MIFISTTLYSTEEFICTEFLSLDKREGKVFKNPYLIFSPCMLTKVSIENITHYRLLLPISNSYLPSIYLHLCRSINPKLPLEYSYTIFFPKM